MTYSETVNWLFAQLPNYQQSGAGAYKPGLNIIKDLSHAIGNPHERLKAVHVAGTNGKGSVSHILAAILQKAGYRVGLFTSPHIKDFRERIKIDGESIGEEVVTNFVTRFKNEIAEIGPTFFEITTAMAFHAFEQHECDIVVIETGLGGRLDSTNILTPELAVITNIGMDHVAFLGNTLTAIASEKAGIIKPNRPVVIGDALEEVVPVFKKVASEKRAPVIFSSDQEQPHYPTDLLGTFQQRNIHTAVVSAKELQKQGWKIDKEIVHEALLDVTGLTSFQGRLQRVGNEPLVILDAAHNLNGMRGLLYEIDQLNFDRLHVVYGAANDKDVAEIVKRFPKEGKYYFSTFSSSRSMELSALEKLGEDNRLDFSVFEAADLALNAAKSKANSGDLIVVCGSFYLLEKII